MTLCSAIVCTSYLSGSFFRLIVRLLVTRREGVVLGAVGVKRERRNTWLAGFGTKKGANGHTRAATERLYIRANTDCREVAFSKNVGCVNLELPRFSELRPLRLVRTLQIHIVVFYPEWEDSYRRQQMRDHG